MKRYFLVVWFVSLFLAGGFADTPRDPQIHVMRRVSIANTYAVPDYTIVEYFGDGQVRVIRDNEQLETDSLAAVPRSIAARDKVNSINVLGLIKSGAVKTVKLPESYDNLVTEQPGMLCSEEIVCAITAVYDGRLMLQPAKKIMQYSDGREITKEYIPNPVVRSYKLAAVAAAVTASSQLDDELFPDRYHPLRAFDGVADTAWSEAVSGPGIDESVAVTFEKPVAVDRISFLPGWFQAQFFKKNNRIKTMEIVLDDYRTTTHFTDAMSAQDISFASLPGKSIKFRKAEFIIKEVYPGTDWNDTPLAGITFFLNNEPILVDGGKIETNASLFPGR